MGKIVVLRFFFFCRVYKCQKQKREGDLEAMWNSLFEGGGLGGTIILSSYVGLNPASTVYQKNLIPGNQAPQKIFGIFATPKNIPILYINLKKRP